MLSKVRTLSVLVMLVFIGSFVSQSEARKIPIEEVYQQLEADGLIDTSGLRSSLKNILDVAGDDTADDDGAETDAVTDDTTAEGGPVTTVKPGAGGNKNETAAMIEMTELSAELQPLIVQMQLASWDENVDHTDEHAAAAVEASTNFTTAYNEGWQKVISAYDYSDFEPELARRFSIQATPGTTALNEEDSQQLSTDVSNMNAASLERICPYESQDCDKEKDGYSLDQVEVILMTLRDPDALVYYWKTWRDTAGAPIKADFLDYVDLMNKAATDPSNRFADAGEMWLQPYTAPGYSTDDFKSEVEELWEATKTLYTNLHAYVRYRLREDGPYKDSFGKREPIPAHILGNMWAQSWENIYDLVTPYDNYTLLDITETLNTSISDEKDMFRYAEEFFTSIGLYQMTENFWNNSMFVQPEDQIAVCHASAWDFFAVNDGGKGPRHYGDYRIKMCTDKTQDDFITIHHEMGHIQYQMAYSQRTDDDTFIEPEQPLIFRDGANPGFHEAIGDTIALSVSTPSHLQMLQDRISSGEAAPTPAPTSSPRRDQRADPTEAPEPTDDEKRDVNQLMKKALEKVAFLPYAYILDKFRWDVFANEYSADVYNYEWWRLRVNEQGVMPPILREKDEDFDPGCKFHVANNVPYIRYFIATILQFQFHDQLCKVGGLVDDANPVYACDIYNNTVSGDLLREMLIAGRSAPWPMTLGKFMGMDEGENGNMTAQAIVDYFKPLNDFLEDQISMHSIEIGWDGDLDEYFVSHVPATVPIVVGVVLCVMIVIVVAAYFVGKNRNSRKLESEKNAFQSSASAGVDNAAMEMDEKKSVSSNDS